MPTDYGDEEDERGDAPLNEWEAPDESDADDDDESEIVPCPYCGRPISEMAELCPYCKSYISREDSPSRKPIWMIIGVAACLVVVVLVWIL